MKRKKGLVFIVSFLSILGLLVFGPTRIAPAETINIGYTGPLSGGTAKYGRNNLEGLEMAVDEINTAGGSRLRESNILLRSSHWMTGINRRIR